MNKNKEPRARFEVTPDGATSDNQAERYSDLDNRFQDLLNECGTKAGSDSGKFNTLLQTKLAEWHEKDFSDLVRAVQERKIQTSEEIKDLLIRLFPGVQELLEDAKQEHERQ